MSAIHAGVIENEDGGDIRVVIANGEAHYDAAFKNEIQSAEFGAYTRSFTMVEAEKLVEVSC